MKNFFSPFGRNWFRLRAAPSGRRFIPPCLASAFALMLSSSVSLAQTTVLSDDFASITTGNSTSTSGSSTAWSGDTSFPTVSSAYQAGGAVKIGSSSAAGSITSKTLDLSVNGGAFSVRFDVKGWTSVEGQIKVTATGLTPQTVDYTAVMAGSFETKTVNFSGGTASSTIKIETTAKRAFIDNVVVYYNSAPNVTSSAATSIATTTATLNGNVTSDGGTTVTERGFCYKTSSGVTISDNKTTVSGTTGAFTLSPTLAVNTHYFFKCVF